MLNELARFMGQYQMVSPGDTVYCAISGGADSVALLWSLYLLRDKLGICLRAAHFNHHLRGEESDADEAFVRELCHRYNIPLEVGHGQIVSGEKGLEAAARDARYSFFESLPGKVATAHTADDNAETVLMHMVRGTGLKGLGGIAPLRGKYIRPMLTVTRQQVLALLEEYCLTCRTDSSNLTDAFLRNRLRHRVMPVLKEENPRLVENLSAMALRLRQDEEALTVTLPEEDRLSVPWLRSLAGAVRSRVLSVFLERCGVKEPQAGHISLAESLVFSATPSASARFPGGVTLTRCYDTLALRTVAQPLPQLALPCPGTLDVPEWGLRITCAPADTLTNGPDCFTVHPSGAVYIRPRRSGDTLRLPGGSRSLKKLLIDRKIPAARRDQLPVVADDLGVLGVYSIGVNLARAAQELPAMQIHIAYPVSEEKEKCSKLQEV